MSLLGAAALVGLAASCWLAVFQLALALGAPWGAMAWGGAEAGRLPMGRRRASAFVAAAAVVWAGAFAQVLGLVAIVPPGSLRGLMWFTAALFALSLLGNALSRSRAERLHGVPLCVALSGAALGCALLL